MRLPPVNRWVNHSGKSWTAVCLAWRGDVVYVSVSKETYPGAKETCTAGGRHAEHCCLAFHVPSGRQLQLPSAPTMRTKEDILASLQGSDTCDGGWAASVGEWHGGGARRVRCAPYFLHLLPVLAAATPAAAQPLRGKEEEEEEEGLGAAWRGRLAYEVHVYMTAAHSALSDGGLVQVVQMASEDVAPSTRVHEPSSLVQVVQLASEEEGPAERRPTDGRPPDTLSAVALGARQDWHRAGECAERGGLMMVRGRECLVVYPCKRARTDVHELLPRTRKSSAALVCLRMRPLVCQCQ